MSFQVKIVSRIEDINEAAWDQLGAGIPCGSLHWTRFAVQMDPAFQPYFILLYQGNQLMGRATAAFNRHHGMSISSSVTRLVVDNLLTRYPLLQCQAAPVNLTCMSGLILPKGNEVEAMRCITEALHELARKHPTSFVAIGWLTEAEHRAVKGIKLFLTQKHTGTVLVNRWSNFDEYLMTLGKTARKDYRQHSNHARKMGIRIELTPKFAQYARQFQSLMMNVDSHYHNSGSAVPSVEFFELAEKEMADKGMMILAWVGDTLAGFGYLLHDQGILKPSLLGKDYRYKYVYFEIFYAMMRYGIDNGFNQIRGGVGGAYQFKRSLGFEDQWSYTAFTSPSPLFKWMGVQLIRSMNNETITEPPAAEPETTTQPSITN
jgi:predicted N-acyltransferase